MIDGLSGVVGILVQHSYTLGIFQRFYECWAHDFDVNHLMKLWNCLWGFCCFPAAFWCVNELISNFVLCALYFLYFLINSAGSTFYFQQMALLYWTFYQFSKKWILHSFSGNYFLLETSTYFHIILVFCISDHMDSEMIHHFRECSGKIFECLAPTAFCAFYIPQ